MIFSVNGAECVHKVLRCRAEDNLAFSRCVVTAAHRSRKSDPKYVSFSLKHRCLQYRHSDAPSEPPYKTVSLFYASAVRELPLAHDNVLDCLTPAQGLSRPSEMLSGSDMRLPPFAFEIVNPFRTHVFRAPSAEACRAWCDALRHMFSEQCFRRPFKVCCRQPVASCVHLCCALLPYLHEYMCLSFVPGLARW